jgi:hypothetical protein
VSRDKTEKTSEGNPRIDVIGYALVMDEQLLTLSYRNFLKTFHVFTSVDVTRPVSVQSLERMASLASRYSLICMALRPFSRALYGSYAQLPRNVSTRLSPAAVWSIKMWRTTLCCTKLRERAFARSFASFIPGTEEYLIEFDASLTGAGFKVFDLQAHRERETLVGAGAIVFGYNTESDSRYQNSCEFIAALLGLASLLRFCHRTGRSVPRAVAFRGDSVTALTWVGNERFRGEYSFCAATVFALVVARLGVQISRADHIPAAENTDTDSLSRGSSVGSVLGPGVADWEPDRDPLVTELKILCDPLEFESRCQDFDTFWRSATNIVSSFFPSY